LSDAMRQCQLAEQLSVSVGDVLGKARAINGIGNVLAAQNDLPNALKNYEQARTLAHGIGDVFDEAGALSNIAFAISSSDPVQAEKNFRQAIDTFKSAGLIDE